MNCFGSDRNTAMENVITPIPHVENTAVVSISPSEYTIYGSFVRHLQCPGIAHRRAFKAIRKLPSRTMQVKHPYVSLLFSRFSPRAEQHHLIALGTQPMRL